VLFFSETASRNISGYLNTQFLGFFSFVNRQTKEVFLSEEVFYVILNVMVFKFKLKIPLKSDK